jgi:hypothetical protein
MFDSERLDGAAAQELARQLIDRQGEDRSLDYKAAMAFADNAVKGKLFVSTCPRAPLNTGRTNCWSGAYDLPIGVDGAPGWLRGDGRGGHSEHPARATGR